MPSLPFPQNVTKRNDNWWSGNVSSGWPAGSKQRFEEERLYKLFFSTGEGGDSDPAAWLMSHVPEGKTCNREGPSLATN